jgi:hypothetical protein
MSVDFFSKYQDIDKDEYLKGIPPFLINSIEEGLPFYIAHMKAMELKDPDDDTSMERLKKSFKFIYNFCKEKKIDLNQYSVYTDAALPQWIEHLRTRKITFYSLHALTFSKPDVESDLLEFVIPKFYLTFQKTRNKFYGSNKMKPFCKKAIEQLNKKLNEQ